jgi:glycosyltransferase involved in cell wall biosynthesis
VKILTVTNIFPSDRHPFSGTYVADQVRSLAGMVSVDVVAKKHASFMGLFPFYVRVAWRMATTEYDIIHAHYGFHSAIVPALFSRKPIVITFHGSDALVEPFRNRLYAFLQRFVVSRAARIIAVSGQVRQTLIDTLGAHTDRIALLPCGVDTTVFTQRSKASAREQLRVQADQKLVLFIGRLTREKGVDVLADASRKLQHIGFYLIGSGPLRWTAANTTFLGVLNHAEIPMWINAADLLVLPSLSEGTPVAVLEALASGTPVVCTAVGSCPDLVVNNRTGMVIPPGDLGALIAAIEQSFRQHFDPEEARQLVLRKYSLGHIARSLHSIYASILVPGHPSLHTVDEGVHA